MSRTPDPFRWSTHDVRDLLPEDWNAELAYLAGHAGVRRRLKPTSVTSREAHEVSDVPLIIVDGEVIRPDAPWLFDLYAGPFRDLAETHAQRTVYCAKQDLYAINLNVQSGRSMRYECHVDSNPVQGMLYVTTHPEADGGALMVANHAGAVSVEDVDRDATQIQPRCGELVLFDARRHAHYVRPVRTSRLRLGVAMNFYTDDSPEGMRPPDLNYHLFEKQ
jgi:hypothetical protein